MKSFMMSETGSVVFTYLSSMPSTVLDFEEIAVEWMDKCRAGIWKRVLGQIRQNTSCLAPTEISQVSVSVPGKWKEPGLENTFCHLGATWLVHLHGNHLCIMIWLLQGSQACCWIYKKYFHKLSIRKLLWITLWDFIRQSYFLCFFNFLQEWICQMHSLV